MVVKVRHVLESLEFRSLLRLKKLRNDSGSELSARGTDELRNALSRSYGRDPQRLCIDMLHTDLVRWLGNDIFVVEGEAYSIENARALPKAVLEAIGTELLQGRAHPLLRRWEFDEDDIEESNRSESYRERFLADLAPDPSPPGLRAHQAEAVERAWARLSPSARIAVQIGTGGGKTRVGNTIVDRWVSTRRERVLWITKDWALLAQAASDLCRNFRGGAYRDLIARTGGDGSELHPLPSQEGLEGGATVRYTTLQTLDRRFDLAGAGLIVWDECHWGEAGSVGDSVFWLADLAGIPVLGLTATPRPPSSSRFEVVYHRTYVELVRDGVLAPYEALQTQTGVLWSPRLRANEFDQSSLVELAKDARRNRTIVDTYLQNRSKFGKTIVFACNVSHSKKLRDLFDACGVMARSITYKDEESESRRSREAFANGDVEVLVNVAKMTHGIDIPHVRTLFLTRPTASDVLFSQMVGRGARKAPGKDRFYIVEFTDNLDRHADVLVTAKRFFDGAPGRVDAPRLPDSRTISDVVVQEWLHRAIIKAVPREGALLGAWWLPGPGTGTWLPIYEDETESLGAACEQFVLTRREGRDPSIWTCRLREALVRRITESALAEFANAMDRSEATPTFVSNPRASSSKAPTGVRHWLAAVEHVETSARRPAGDDSGNQ
jgi:superfamily II DNA or RNA helicase